MKPGIAMSSQERHQRHLDAVKKYSARVRKRKCKKCKGRFEPFEVPDGGKGGMSHFCKRCKRLIDLEKAENGFLKNTRREKLCSVIS
jgi:hypothetical protein